MFGAPKQQQSRKNGPAKVEPTVAAVPSVRTYTPPPTLRDYGTLAAEARQHEIDQENRIHSLEDELRKTLNRLDLVEEANKMLLDDLQRLKEDYTSETTRLKGEHKTELFNLTRERNYYYEYFLKMRTRLVVNAKIITDALEETQGVQPLKNYPDEPAELPEEEDRMIDKFRPPGQRKYETPIAPDHEAPTAS